MDKKIDVRNKYSVELMNINNKLNQLEKGRIYDLTNAQMDGYREVIEDLIYKVEYYGESDNERLRKAHNKFHVE